MRSYRLRSRDAGSCTTINPHPPTGVSFTVNETCGTGEAMLLICVRSSVLGLGYELDHEAGREISAGFGRPNRDGESSR